MKKMLFNSIFVMFIMYIIPGMTGCGEETVIEPAKIIVTAPANGGEMFDNESLVIDFDKFVTNVEVNGTPAEVTGPRAIWKVQGLEPGNRVLKIQWTDENGNEGSQEITILIRKSSDIVC